MKKVEVTVGFVEYGRGLAIDLCGLAETTSNKELKKELKRYIKQADKYIATTKRSD